MIIKSKSHLKRIERLNEAERKRKIETISNINDTEAEADRLRKKKMYKRMGCLDDDMNENLKSFV